MKYIDIDSSSNKIKIDAIQCMYALDDAVMKYRPYRGSMMWRNISGTDYLIHQINRRQNSLGPRSVKTELTYNSFQKRKSELFDRIATLKDKQSRNAKLCKAINLNRVPLIVADISRKLSEFPELSKKTLIVGTNALYAYEAAAAVFFESDIVATADVDILWDTRHKVSIASSQPQGFIGLLKSIDKSFEVMTNNKFRAANKDGFIVDLIQPMSKDVIFSESSAMSDFPDDLVAAEIKGLEWLVSCPKFSAVGIDDQGYPVTLVAPDPRAFVMHKHWLSRRGDRDVDKKTRDFEQSLAVLDLIKEKLSYLDFGDAALKAMPQELRNYIAA